MQQHVKTSSKQAEVYCHLRVLLQEGSEGGFQLRLLQFLSWLSEDEVCLLFWITFRNSM